MPERTTKPVTRKMVNDALRARGRDESLYPGDGYFFFGGGDAVHWLSSSVMVKRISDLTLEQWLAKFEESSERDKKLTKQMTRIAELESSPKPQSSRTKIRRRTP
jgi:hypothetical protein